MNKKLLALYGLKWNPLYPELPAEALKIAPSVDQHGGQAPGVGFPISRLVGVISLSSGAVLDVDMGPYK